MAFGVTDDGFVVKPLETIEDELKAELRADLGESLPLTGDTNLGVIVGIFAEKFSELWDLGQAVYAAMYPDSASTDEAMENIAAITGTLREVPVKSTVTLSMTGTPATAVPAETKFSVTATEVQFENIAQATIAAATAWAISTVYVVGDIRTNASRIYRCITNGTSAGSGGPTTTSTDITDNTAHWRYLGEGTGYITAACESVDYGAIVAAAFTLVNIDTPVAGLSNVTNLADAVPGAAEETLSALRVRREDELRVQGNSAPDAIRADLLLVTGVTSATVFYNDTDATDGNGLPPHSVEALVLGGTSAAVAAALFASAAGGIKTYGSVTESVNDASGNAQSVRFSRPDGKDAYIKVTVLTNANFPATGAADIKQALVNYAEGNLLDESGTAIFGGYQAGDDLIHAKLYLAILSIDGIDDVTALTSALVASGAGAPGGGSYTTANKAVAARELLVFDTAFITITVT